MSGTATTQIIEALDETSEGPKRLIGEIVSILGEQTALELLQETQDIESSGGQMIKRGTRRRTPGGVFFRLAKGKMSPDQRRRVFQVLETQRKPKKAPPPKASPPPKRRDRPSRGQMPASRLSRADRLPAPRDVSPPGPVRRRRIVEVGGVDMAPPPRPPEPPASTQQPAPARRRIVSAADNLVKLPRPVAPVKLVDQAKARRSRPDAITARSRIAAILDMLDPDKARRLLVGLALERTGAQGIEARRKVERDLDELVPEADSTAEDFGAASGPLPELEERATEAPDLDGLRARVLAKVTDALGLSEFDLARALYDDESSESRRRASQLLETLGAADDRER